MNYLKDKIESDRKIPDEMFPDVKIECEVMYLKIGKVDECDICGAKCDEHGYYTCNCYSPCCGAKMYPDSDICPKCHEHCI